MTVDVVTFGCRLNAHDSDRVADLAAAAGVRDTVVINSCAVTAEAVRQARQQVRRVRKARPGAKILVTGCAATTDRSTFAAMPEVDGVISNHAKLTPRTWAAMSAGTPAPDQVTPQRLRRARAYVEVQNGCDHRCTFCVIPFGRGASRSVPIDAVVAEVRARAAERFAEVVLTGVDLTAYGADLAGAPALGRLVAAILQRVPELPRLRLSSLDAAEVDPELEALLISEPRLMPHVHLSLQAGSDMILKRMRRRHRRADAVRFCERLRARRHVAIGADLIAGFPTETEEWFAETLSLADDCGLTYLHVFPFSPRPGTPAARMPQLPRATVKHRAQRLRRKADERLTAWLTDQVGREKQILVETPARGRTECYAEVSFESPRPAAAVGRITSGRVRAHESGRLLVP